MTIKKYLKQVADLFDQKKRKCDKEKKCLREALQRLKKREDELESKLDKAKKDKEKKKLRSELKTVHAQYHKGQELLKDLENN